MVCPASIGVIDLMLEIPAGEAGMDMAEARRLTRDKGTDQFSHHPAQYLFKDVGERMSKVQHVDTIVAMMNQHGVAMAQISVDPRNPEPALAIFDKHPKRSFGEVGVNPNVGMKSVLSLAATVALHPNIRAASAAPCLLSPQVAIDHRCPGLSYERIFGEMDSLPLEEAAWPAFLRGNAVRVYGLEKIFADDRCLVRP